MRRADILDDRTQNVTEYGGRFNLLEYGPDDHGTSHFNVVDQFGGAVVRFAFARPLSGPSVVDRKAPWACAVEESSAAMSSCRGSRSQVSCHPASMLLRAPCA